MDSIIVYIAPALMSFVLIAASSAKSANLGSFRDQLLLVLPQVKSVKIRRNLAKLIVGVELIVGLWGVTGTFARYSAATMAFIFCVFTLIRLQRLVAGRTAPCECFGSLGGTSLTWFSVGWVAALTLAAATSVILWPTSDLHALKPLEALAGLGLAAGLAACVLAGTAHRTQPAIGT